MHPVDIEKAREILLDLASKKESDCDAVNGAHLILQRFPSDGRWRRGRAAAPSQGAEPRRNGQMLTT